ncbi:hypothetical protein BH11PAT1_BH11PAT1_7030 [soil metagenome]
MNKKYQFLLVSIIIILGLFTRFYGLNWDQGYHLHPDERAIVLFTLKLAFPRTIHEFLAATSGWNPHFFAYGSLPLYLLYAAAGIASHLSFSLGSYDGINLVGRGISASADVAIILLLFFLGKKLFSPFVGILSACFYTMSTFALQAAHFYAVDTMLTLFTLLALFSLIQFQMTHRYKRLVGFAVCLGLAVATKISAIILLTPFILTLLYVLFHEWQTAHSSLSKKISVMARHGFLLCSTVGIVLVLTFAFCEPYALISFSEFWKQTSQQSEMTRSAFTFPYTLQYVGIIPYLYELKQIFFWGQGPFLAFICFGGVIYTSLFFYKHPEKKNLGILLSFFWIYFAVVGSFAVGFMRYMLPLYPLFCLFGAYGYVTFLHRLPRSFHIATLTLTLLLILILPVSFLHIYTQPNTRVQATEWILNNIPQGSTIAGEHWDDQLPLKHAELYQAVTLALYEPDTPAKWALINSQLQSADYLILASNRLSTPLQKLTDCKKLLPHPCYTLTAAYYHNLFAGKRGFKRIKEFSLFPTIPLLNLKLHDATADESFTVYDHPTVVIFKKQAN